ncbi:MAG: SUMF1/EgtB/PvdO family nonheme iron enzyme, partial [Dokdonella sp.]|uniref:formylglycine-generating enzyme family protein n=1 Tax=Dokdonella sp. TaxID=2291710 RepID=UPI0032643ED6
RAEQLRLAASLVLAGHLTSPAGNNAAERYLALIAADEQDRDALKGIGRILAALSLKASNAIAEDDPRSAIEPMAQANMIAERAKMKAAPAFAAFVAPIHDAVEKRRARSRDPFDPSIGAMTPLVPALERIDPEQARALKADIERPDELLRTGGKFRDPGGFTMAVMTRSSAAGARIDHPFAVAGTDVTRGGYARFASASGRRASPCRESQGLLARLARGVDWRAPGFTQTDQHPVVCVSWEDADAYAQWLGKRVGAHYRLPTSQEWLLAAQAAGKDTSCRNANIDHGRTCDDGFPHTSPVGRFAATPQGLYDVSGNVSVWVDGCARGAGGSGCAARTFRGLSWNDDGDESNLARSDTAAGNLGYANVGFRLVRELPSPKE